MDTSEPGAEGAPKARVSRSFRLEEKVTDAVAFPDWELLGDVAELLEPLVLPVGEGDVPEALGFSAQDARGGYEAGDLASFREELEGRGVDVEWIYVKYYGMERDGQMRAASLSFSGNNWISVRVQSGDEILVNGVMARLLALAQAAHRRFEDAQGERTQAAGALETATRSNSVGTPIPTASLPLSKRVGRVSLVVNHPWTVTIVGSTIAAIVAGVVLYVLLR